MIFSENRFPLLGIMLSRASVSLSARSLTRIPAPPAHQRTRRARSDFWPVRPAARPPGPDAAGVRPPGPDAAGARPQGRYSAGPRVFRRVPDEAVLIAAIPRSEQSTGPPYSRPPLRLPHRPGPTPPLPTRHRGLRRRRAPARVRPMAGTAGLRQLRQELSSSCSPRSCIQPGNPMK